MYQHLTDWETHAENMQISVCFCRTCVCLKNLENIQISVNMINRLDITDEYSVKCDFILNTVTFIDAALNILLRKLWKGNVLWFYLFGQGVPNETKSTINLRLTGPDDLSLFGPIGVKLLDFCYSSVSELVCCWVLILFHLSDESWWILYVRYFDSLMSRGPSRGPNVYVDYSPWLNSKSFMLNILWMDKWIKMEFCTYIAIYKSK